MTKLNLNELFGKTLTKTIYHLSVNKNTTMGAIKIELAQYVSQIESRRKPLSEHAVQKWMRGNPPKCSRMKNIVMCFIENGVPNEILNELILIADCPELALMLEEADILNNIAITKTLYKQKHNIPRSPYTEFIGRQQEIAEIIDLLSYENRAWIVCINGMGGVGKTALAHEVVDKLLNSDNPSHHYEAIIWVTAKHSELFHFGIRNRRPTFTNLDDLHRNIAEVLEIPAIHATRGIDRDIVIQTTLSKRRVLLILDNLEDIDDPSLITFLRDLPTPSKAIITSRHRIGLAAEIQLDSLSRTEVMLLVQSICTEINLHLSDHDIDRIYKITGGLPLAITLILGRMIWYGNDLDFELEQLINVNDQLFEFSYQQSLKLISDSNTFNTFMALSLFPKCVRRDVIGHIVEFGKDYLSRDRALKDLEVLSLVKRNGDCFYMETITRIEAAHKLANYEDANRIKERWVNYYLKFVKANGGRDIAEWHKRYDHLEEEWVTVLSVLDYCMSNDLYTEVWSFWQQLRNYTHIYGYWSDRLIVIDWLIIESERNGKWGRVVWLLSDKGFNLTLMGTAHNLKEAEQVLTRAWELRMHALPKVVIGLANNIAGLKIRQEHFIEAHNWLVHCHELLDEANLEKMDQSRLEVFITYNQAENYFRRRNHLKARELFVEVLNLSTSITWQRANTYALNWIADIDILLNKPDVLISTEQSLLRGLAETSRNKDKRRVACYYRSLGRLYFKQSDFSQAEEHFKKAYEFFSSLGMSPESSQVQSRLAAIQSISHQSK